MRKLLIVVIVVVLLIPLLVSCTAGDPLPDPLYTSDIFVDGSLYVNGVEINEELKPPAIYVRWSVTTTSSNPVTMWVDGVNGDYYTLNPHSAVIFKLLIIARDDTAGEIGVWKIDNGSIERAGANTATLKTGTTNVVLREDITWSVTVTGLPAEDALNITVIGDAINETKWSAVLYGAEVHY